MRNPQSLIEKKEQEQVALVSAQEYICSNFEADFNNISALTGIYNAFYNALRACDFYPQERPGIYSLLSLMTADRLMALWDYSQQQGNYQDWNFNYQLVKSAWIGADELQKTEIVARIFEQEPCNFGLYFSGLERLQDEALGQLISRLSGVKSANFGLPELNNNILPVLEFVLLLEGKKYKKAFSALDKLLELASSESKLTAKVDQYKEVVLESRFNQRLCWESVVHGASSRVVVWLHLVTQLPFNAKCPKMYFKSRGLLGFESCEGLTPIELAGKFCRKELVDFYSNNVSDEISSVVSEYGGSSYGDDSDFQVTINPVVTESHTAKDDNAAQSNRPERFGRSDRLQFFMEFQLRSSVSGAAATQAETQVGEQTIYCSPKTQ